MATEDPIYVDYPDAVYPHIRFMQRTGEIRFGVAEPTLIQSALARPQQAAHYENADIIRQAATLCFGLIKNHPWHGGNKRTATVIVDEFLFRNGYEVAATQPEVVGMVLAVESDQFGVDEIETWYRQRTTFTGKKLMKTIRIANGQGFWGDWLEAPVQLVERGPIDYLTLDYLAEITMSILQKQKSRDPKAGYARDFLTVVSRVLPKCLDRNIKIVANAGGVNPQACVAGLTEVVRKLGLAGKVKIGVVAGDDIMDRLDEFIAKNIALENMESGEPLSGVRDRVQSANVYFGAAPIVEALRQGARIVVTGRCTDTGLTLAPMIHEFGWKMDDWNKVATGTIAGHIIECGAQTTGGNCQVDWQTIPDFWDIGYPIVEASEDGTFVVTKHAGTGGRITVAGVTEQLMYEMGDPKNYITPDGVADFTSIKLEQDGENRVRVSGIQGGPATDLYKVSISFSDGFKAAGGLIYAWPDAYAKAKAADAMLRRRLENLGLKFEEMRSQFIGVDATHEGLGGEPSPNIAEVMLRVAVRAKERAAIERFTTELAPLALAGPPTVTGFGGGRPKVEEVVAYWPALIPKSAVAPTVEIITA